MVGEDTEADWADSYRTLGLLAPGQVDGACEDEIDWHWTCRTLVELEIAGDKAAGTGDPSLASRHRVPPCILDWAPGPSPGLFVDHWHCSSSSEDWPCHWVRSQALQASFPSADHVALLR